MVAAVTWLDPLESFLNKNIQLGGVDGFTCNNLQDNNYYVKKAKCRKNIYCYLKKNHTLVSALAISGRICKKQVSTGALDPPGTVGDGDGQPADLPHDAAP